MDGYKGSGKLKMVTSTEDFFLLKILTVRPLELYHPKFGKGNYNVTYDGINSSITFSHHFVTLQYILYSVKHIYILFYRTCSQQQEILTIRIFFYSLRVVLSFSPWPHQLLIAPAHPQNNRIELIYNLFCSGILGQNSYS